MPRMVGRWSITLDLGSPVRMQKIAPGRRHFMYIAMRSCTPHNRLHSVNKLSQDSRSLVATHEIKGRARECLGNRSWRALFVPIQGVDGCQSRSPVRLPHSRSPRDDPTVFLPTPHFPSSYRPLRRNSIRGEQRRTRIDALSNISGLSRQPPNQMRTIRSACAGLGVLHILLDHLCFSPN